MPPPTISSSKTRSQQIREMTRTIHDREGSDASSTGSNHGTITLGSSIIADGNGIDSYIADSTIAGADDSFAPSLESEVMCSTRDVNFSFYPSHSHKKSTRISDANYEDPCQKLSNLESALDPSQKLPELRNTAKKYQHGAHWSPRKDELAFNTSAIETAFQDFSSGPISDFSGTFDALKSRTRFRSLQQAGTPVKGRQQSQSGARPLSKDALSDSKANRLPKRQPLQPTSLQEVMNNSVQADTRPPFTQTMSQKENIPPASQRSAQPPYISHASRTTSGEKRALADLQARVADESDLSLLGEGQRPNTIFEPKNTRFSTRSVSHSKQAKDVDLQDATNQSCDFTGQQTNNQLKYAVQQNGTVQSTDFNTQTTSSLSKLATQQDRVPPKRNISYTGGAKQASTNYEKFSKQYNISEFMSETADDSKRQTQRKPSVPGAQPTASQRKRSSQQNGTTQSAASARDIATNQSIRQIQSNESGFSPIAANASRISLLEPDQHFSYPNQASPNPTQSFILPQGISDQYTATLNGRIPIFTSSGQVKMGSPSEHPVNGINTPLQEGQIVEHLESYKSQCRELVMSLVEQERRTYELTQENKRLRDQVITSTGTRLEKQGLKSQLDKENQEKEDLRKEIEYLRLRFQQEKENWRKEQRELRTKLDQEQQVNANLRAEIDSVQSRPDQGDHFQQAIKSMQTKNGHLSRENDFLQSQLQQQLEDMQSRENKLEEDMQTREGQLKKGIQNLEEASKKDMQRLRRENQDSAQALQKLKLESSRLQHDQKTRFQQIIESIEKENENLRQSNEDLLSRLSKQTEAVQTHQQQARREKEAMRSSFQQELEVLNSRIREAEKRFNEVEFTQENREAREAETSQWEPDSLNKIGEIQQGQQESMTETQMQAEYTQDSQKIFEDMDESLMQQDQDTRQSFEEIGESQAGNDARNPAKSTIQLEQKRTKLHHRRYQSVEDNTIQSNTSHRRHHSETFSEPGGRLNARNDASRQVNVEKINLASNTDNCRQFHVGKGKRPLSAPARQVLDSLCDHNAANCNVCGRVSDVNSIPRTVKKTLLVPKPPLMSPIRPRRDPGLALATVIKCLQDELQHMGMKANRLNTRWLNGCQRLGETMSDNERQTLKDRIDVHNINLKMKSDQLHALFHVLEGQKAAGQDMPQDELEVTIQAIGINLNNFNDDDFSRLVGEEKD